MAYSYVQYTGNGSTTNFTFPFGYLSKDHIHVKVDGVEVPFSWLGDFSVQVSPAPASGTLVEIRRNTPLDQPAVDWVDGSTLTEQDMDLDTIFNLYANQEARDYAEASVQLDSEGIWDGRGRSTRNFADPIGPTSLVTKRYFDDVYTPALDSKVAAAAASAAAASASATASAASAVKSEAFADEAEEALKDFNDRYQGARPTDPTMRPDGSPLQAGDLYFNTSASEMRVYTGTVWAQTGSPISGLISIPPSPIIATPGQVSIPVPGGFDAPYIQVFVNGVKVDPPVVDVSDGENIVFNPALEGGEEITYVAFGAFNAVDIDSAAVKIRAPSARSIERTLEDRLRESVSIKDFGAIGDGQKHTVQEWIDNGTFPSLAAVQEKFPFVTGVDNYIDRVATQAAVNYVASLPNGGCVQVPPGSYWYDLGVTNRTGKVAIVGVGQPILNADLPATSSDGIFEFQSNALHGPITDITSNISNGDATITVADASSFSVGDIIRIQSTEYFAGFDGYDGYSTTVKGELNVVKRVEGNVITLLDRAKDSYIANATLRVRKLDMVQDYFFYGLRFRGQGVTPEGQALNGLGAKGIQVTYAVGVTVLNCFFSNQQRAAFSATTCRDLLIDQCVFDGYDITKANNQPNGSPWFTGAQFKYCENIVFSNNLARNSRRPCDFESHNSAQPVCRGIVISNCTSINCQSVQGTHVCENVVISNCVGIGCAGGIIFRGKNISIVNCRLGKVTGYLVQIGSGPTTMSSSVPCEVGDVSIIGCTGETSGTQACSLRQTARSYVMEGCVWTTFGNGFTSYARKANMIRIKGNTFMCTDGGTSNFPIGVAFPNPSAGAIQLLDMVQIEDNVFVGFYDSVQVRGPSGPMTSGDYLSISRNMFKRSRNRDVVLGPTSTGTVPRWNRVNVNDNMLSRSLPLSLNIGENAHGVSVACNRPRFGFDSSVVRARATQVDFTSGNIRLGQIIPNLNPTSGAFVGWVCTSPGTRGLGTSINQSVNISAGSNTFINTADNLAPGVIVSIAGAGPGGAALVSEVIDVDPATGVATLADNASSTVSGASLTPASPTLRTFGAIS